MSETAAPLDDLALDQLFRAARTQNKWQDRPVPDAKLHELGERWTTLKAEYTQKAETLKSQYAEKAGAMKTEYAEKKTEYTERAVAQFDEARAALAEMRREVQQALQLLDHAAQAV